MKHFFTSIALLFAASVHAQNFTDGNISVARVGDGKTQLTETSSPVSILEYAPNINKQSKPIKIVNLGNSKAEQITVSGSSNVYEGQLSRSADGRYLSMIGYKIGIGSSNADCQSADTKKVIARIDNSGIVDYSTSFPTSENCSVRTAVTEDGSSFWVASSSNISFVNFGQASIPTNIFNQSQRSLGIFKKQLYAQASYGNLVLTKTALPQASSSIETVIKQGSNNFHSFAFLDADATISWNNTGYDLLYVTDLAFGISKYYFDGKEWIVANAGNTPPNIAYYSNAGASVLTATLNSKGEPVLYYVSSQKSNNQLLSTIDVSGRTGNFSYATAITKVLAQAGENYMFRGVALSPIGTSK